MTRRTTGHFPTVGEWYELRELRELRTCQKAWPPPSRLRCWGYAKMLGLGYLSVCGPTPARRAIRPLPRLKPMVRFSHGSVGKQLASNAPES